MTQATPDTEAFDQAYADIDRWTTPDLVAGMADNQAKALAAIRAASDQIAMAVDAIAARLAQPGSRLVLVGAGTSGRLAVQEAAELLPTFGWPPERALAYIAGGAGAFLKAVERAEDDDAAGDAIGADLGTDDILIGIAASGRTPYTIGAITAARAKGALTIGIANSRNAALTAKAEIGITLETGPEFLSGSTRMTAGTSQKIVLNMLTTGAMIRNGHVYRGLMVGVQVTNDKLLVRATGLVATLTGLDQDAARAVLEAAGRDVRIAVVMHRLGLDHASATARLAAAGGHLGAVLEG